MGLLRSVEERVLHRFTSGNRFRPTPGKRIPVFDSYKEKVQKFLNILFFFLVYFLWNVSDVSNFINDRLVNVSFTRLNRVENTVTKALVEMCSHRTVMDRSQRACRKQKKGVKGGWLGGPFRRTVNVDTEDLYT